MTDFKIGDPFVDHHSSYYRATIFFHLAIALKQNISCELASELLNFFSDISRSGEMLLQANDELELVSAALLLFS
jgi:hypothetical protein